MKVPAIAVLITAGLQVPVMPLFDNAGNAGGTEFWQSGPIWVKVGRICGVMVTSMKVATPHCDGLSGVKLKVNVPAVVVLMTAGLQVPVIPLFETFGNAGGAEFWQSGPICVNAGSICGLMVIFMVAVVDNWLSSGVKE